jgi:Phage integrase, N-terminal SAM-like domain
MTYDWRPTASRSATTTAETPVVRAAAAVTVGAAIEEFIEAAEQGRAVNRSGRRYRDSALRDLTGILRYHVAPALGERQLADIRRVDIQSLVDRLGQERLSESRIRSVISALRALYAYAIDQRYAEYNPADSLEMPAVSPDAATHEQPHMPPPPPPPPATAAREEPDEPGDPDARDDGEDRDRDDDYQPIAVWPERLVSLALRAALIVFAVVAIISLLQPA